MYKLKQSVSASDGLMFGGGRWAGLLNEYFNEYFVNHANLTLVCFILKSKIISPEYLAFFYQHLSSEPNIELLETVNISY